MSTTDWLKQDRRVVGGAFGSNPAWRGMQVEDEPHFDGGKTLPEAACAADGLDRRFYAGLQAISTRLTGFVVADERGGCKSAHGWFSSREVSWIPDERGGILEVEGSDSTVTRFVVTHPRRVEKLDRIARNARLVAEAHAAGFEFDEEGDTFEVRDPLTRERSWVFVVIDRHTGVLDGWQVHEP